jgi:NADPH2:quinone reductase
MRAIVCKELGPPSKLVLEEVPAPVAGPGQAVIDVHACGVNFPDTLIIEGKYQFRPSPPFSPGGEVAGVVSAVGEGVTAVRPGDRVIALMPWGGYAEQVLADPTRLQPVPDGVPLDVAASLLTAYGTTYYAFVDRASLRAGETVLVLGAAGGVGVAAIELGKLMGARVIAVASTEEKRALCTRLGADAAIGYENLKDAVRSVAPNGVDVVYDAVGGPHSEVALRTMAWGGRHLVVGFAAGEIPRIPLNLTLLKSCSIVGVFWGAWLQREPARAIALHAQLLEWVRDGKLRPPIHARYPLAEAPRALEELLARRVQGKAVVVTRT